MGREDVECNRCGEEGLHWLKIGNDWKLHDYDGDLHVCEIEEDHSDDFDRLNSCK